MICISLVVPWKKPGPAACRDASWSASRRRLGIF